VALAPELNVSSFGETPEEAQESITEALEAFLEECERMGTLEDILEESGFLKLNDEKESPITLRRLHAPDENRDH
jgi:predicted RNase H-like HicB family nuclease